MKRNKPLSFKNPSERPSPADAGPKHEFDRGRLRQLLSPRSVAIVGASARSSTVGNAVLDNLRRGGYDGAIYAIHPSAPAIDGLSTWASVSELPEPVDCVVLSVPAAAAATAVEEAATLGAGAVIVISSGFSEAGPDGFQLTNRLRRAAADTGMPILGPNCLGLANFAARTALTFVRGYGAMTATMATGSGLAVVTQSGALGTNLLPAYLHGTKFSYLVATGNSSVLDVGDVLEAIASDPYVTGICLLYEGLRPGSTLLAALATAASHQKPVVVVKGGRSAAGRAAVGSHTASAVGDDAACRAALEAYGAMVVNGPEELIAATTFLAGRRIKRPRSPAVGIMSGSGGLGVLLCDSAEDHDVRLAELTEPTRETLAKALPSYAAISNPVDLTAGSINGDGVHEVAKALLDESQVGALVVALSTSIHDEIGSDRMKAIADLAADSEIPVVSILVSENRAGASLDTLESANGVSVFRDTDLCMRTLAHWMQGSQDIAPRGYVSDVDWPTIDAVLSAANAGSGGLLDEPTSMAIASALGLRTPKSIVISNPTDFKSTGWDTFPCVAKVVSNDLAHKAEIGGVIVGLNDADSVVAALEQIRGSVALHSSAVISGFLLQEMIPSGHEILLGTIRDPAYGPIVAIGYGGGEAGNRSAAQAVSAAAGRALVMRAVDAAPATAMLEEEARLAIIDLMMSFGALMRRYPQIDEVEINPLLLVRGSSDLVGVDAVIRVRQNGRSAD